MFCMFLYYFFDCCYLNIVIWNLIMFIYYWSFNFLKVEYIFVICYSYDGCIIFCVGWYCFILIDCRDSNCVDIVYVFVVCIVVVYYFIIFC